jgi:thymidylate synthase (FAD)
VKVSLISITKPTIPGVETPEELISYCARVSNPLNQLNTQTAPKLLKYLIDHKHWSPMEMVSLAFEIQTSRAVAAQILRHRSFSFQEFSQRYSSVTQLEKFELRKQGKTNRQVGEDPILSTQDPELFAKMDKLQNQSLELYGEMISKGVARECARMVLPLNTSTTMYMTGTVRSWLSYFNVRLEQGTQKEHREIAIAEAKIFATNFPCISQSVNTFNNFTGGFM